MVAQNTNLGSPRPHGRHRQEHRRGDGARPFRRCVRLVVVGTGGVVLAVALGGAGTGAGSPAPADPAPAVGTVAGGTVTAVTRAAHPAPGAAPPETGRRWAWPVERPWRVTAPFRAPETRFAAGHRGIDVAASLGAPVLAPADGVVAFVGTVVERPVITIKHDGGLVTSFEAVEATVPAGTPVNAGDRIGTVAGGGHCDGRCVHFGVRLRGDYVSPMLYLGGFSRAVLLPFRDELSRG